MRHIRNTADREWSAFPEAAPAALFESTFEVTNADKAHSLRLCQEDVKQTWKIMVNDQPVGQLHRDENPIEGYWELPADVLQEGQNSLEITTSSRTPDDILVGGMQIFSDAPSALLSESSVTVTVLDSDSEEDSPCRIRLSATGV